MKTPLLVALVGLAGTAYAQPTDFLDPETNNVIGAWNTLTAPNNFHDVLTAKLDNNLDLDAVYRTDDGLIVTTDLVLGGRSFAYSMDSISAMAPWPKANGDTYLLLADSYGITVVHFAIDRVANLVTWTEALFAEPLVAGLTDLVHIPANAQHADYWIGLCADKRTLVAIKQNANTASGLSLWPAFSGACAADAWELEAIDFDGNGTSELAALTEAGLALFNSEGGSLRAVYPLAATTGMIRAISTVNLNPPGPNTNQIAWIRPGPSTEHEVAVVTSTSVTTSQSLGTYVPVGACTGDMDGDGSIDLALTVSDASKVLLLRNVAGDLNLTDHELLTTGLPASTNNVAQPLTVDVDGDGSLDVLCADASQTALVLIRNRPGPPSEPEIKYFEYINATTGNMVMRNYGGHIAVPPLDATHLQMIMSLQLPDSTLGPEGEWDYPLPVGLPFFEIEVPVQRSRSAAPFAVATVEYNDPLVTGTSEYITHFIARLVQIESGEVVQVWPPVFGVIVDSNFTEALAFVEDTYPNAIYPNVIDLNIGNGEKAGKTKLPPPKTPPPPPLPTDD